MKRTEALELITNGDEAYKAFYCLVYYKDTLKHIIKELESEVEYIEDFQKDDLKLSDKDKRMLELWKIRRDKVKRHYEKMIKSK